MSYNEIPNILVDSVVLPNKPLSDPEIIDAAKKPSLYGFRGVFLRDTLPKKSKIKRMWYFKFRFIFCDGTHWVIWFKKGEENFYFNSYGVQPPSELIAYPKSPIFYNSERVQQRVRCFAVIYVFSH